MKKMLKIILLAFILISVVDCKAKPVIYDRNTLPYYGVKKQVDISDKKKIMKTTAVDANDKVYDFRNLISDNEELKLVNELQAFSEKNKTEFIILVDDNFQDISNVICNTQLGKQSIINSDKNHAIDFYNYNDFGINYPNYSGVILYINTYANPCDDINYLYMIPFGDATRYMTSEIIDNISGKLLPYINEEKYYDGIKNTLVEIEKYKELDSNNGIKEKITTYKNVEFPKSLVIFDFVIALIIVLVLVKKNIMVSKQKTAYNYVKRGSLKIKTKKDKLII